ncbi:MAG: hypothetical protein JW846_01535 [Dehalococcoidia bacterium]|nr:hypothetical protein [Dehalococcoidia bacterium]
MGGAKRWLRAHRALMVTVAAISVISISVVLLEKYSIFYDHHYSIVVSSESSERVVEIAKGQLLKLMVRSNATRDGNNEDYVVVIRQATQTGSGKWVTGYIMKDCPRVSDGQVVNFKAPHSGSYEIAIRSRSGENVSATVCYFIGDWTESMRQVIIHAV